MASGPEGTEALNYKTWVLKVSIHCAGCERKIKRILHKVKGVYAIEIDANQNRVTVTGNVDSESLIQKLLKYGKHAELLPEKNPSTATNSSNAAAAAAVAAKTEAKGNEKAVPVAPAAEPETEEKKKAEKGKAVIESPETPPAASAVSDELTAPKPDTDSKSQPEKAPAADANSEKKGKEKNREESKLDERELSATAGVNSPPRNSFPAYFQPSYAAVRYHTVHPSTSHAYYAPPPPEMPSSYAYYSNSPVPAPAAYPPPAEYSPPYYYSSESYYGSIDQPSPSADSYDMFNDENPNACKLM